MEIILGSIIAASLIAISAALWYMLLSNRTIAPATPDPKSPNIRIKNFNLTATTAKKKKLTNTEGRIAESVNAIEAKNNDDMRCEKTAIQLNAMALGKMPERNEDYNLRKRVLQRSHIVGKELSNEIHQEQVVQDASKIMDSVNDRMETERSQNLSDVISEFTDPSIGDMSMREIRSFPMQPFTDATVFSRESSLESYGERALHSQDSDSAIGSCDDLSSAMSYMQEQTSGNLVQHRVYESKSPTKSKQITVEKEGCEFRAPYGRVNFPAGAVEESTGITITPHYECQTLDKRMLITCVIEFQSANKMEFLKHVQVLFYTPYSAAESGKPVNVELMRMGRGGSTYHSVQSSVLNPGCWISFWTKRFCRLGVAIQQTDRVHTKKRYYSAAIARDTTQMQDRVISWMVCEDMPNVKEINIKYFEATDNQRVIDAESFEVGYEYNLRLKLSSQGKQGRPAGETARSQGFLLDIDKDTFTLPLHQRYCIGFDKKSQIHLATNEEDKFMLKLRYQACAIGFDSDIRDKELFDGYCYLDWSSKEQPITQINALGAGSSGIRMDFQAGASQHDVAGYGSVLPQGYTSGYGSAGNVRPLTTLENYQLTAWDSQHGEAVDRRVMPERHRQLLQEEHGESNRRPTNIDDSLDMRNGSNRLEIPTYPKHEPLSPESHPSMPAQQYDSLLLTDSKLTDCGELRDAHHPQPLPRKKLIPDAVTEIKLGHQDEESVSTKHKHA